MNADELKSSLAEIESNMARVDKAAELTVYMAQIYDVYRAVAALPPGLLAALGEVAKSAMATSRHLSGLLTADYCALRGIQDGDVPAWIAAHGEAVEFGEKATAAFIAALARVRGIMESANV